jgi:hypothetical protein
MTTNEGKGPPVNLTLACVLSLGLWAVIGGLLAALHVL